MQHLLFKKGFLNKAHRQNLLIAAVITALPYLAHAEDTMPEVSVSATSNKETAHSNTEGYVANRTTTATKTDTPIIETPQSISVVTSQQMQEQGATTLQEAVRYSVGVTSEAYGTDNRGDWLFIRGIEHTQIVDGLRSQTITYNMPRPDPYFLERIEILRGPSSVLFGQASPGGLVNIVSKRPQAENNTEVTAEYGTRDHEKLGIDSTGKLTDDGRVLYRIVGSVKQEDYRSDFTDNKRFKIAPSLTFQPDDKTSLTLFMNYMNDRTNGATASFPPHVGTLLSSPNGKIGTNFFSGEPGFDGTDAKETSFGWEFYHEFNDTWTVRQNARYTSSEWDYKSLYPNIFKAFGYNGQRQVARFGFASLSDSETYAIDNQAQPSLMLVK